MNNKSSWRNQCLSEWTTRVVCVQEFMKKPVHEWMNNKSCVHACMNNRSSWKNRCVSEWTTRVLEETFIMANKSLTNNQCVSERTARVLEETIIMAKFNQYFICFYGRGTLTLLLRVDLHLVVGGLCIQLKLQNTKRLRWKKMQLQPFSISKIWEWKS